MLKEQELQQKIKAEVARALEAERMELLTNAGDKPKVLMQKGHLVYNQTDSVLYTTDGNDLVVVNEIKSETKASGDYTMFSDGTLMCRGRVIVAGEQTWVYPVKFVFPPVITATKIGTGTNNAYVVVIGDVTPADCLVNIRDFDNLEVAGDADIFAVGRWK